MISCGEGDGAARVHTRAGRRSAGLGGDGRAHVAVCVPQTRCGDVGDGAICSVVVHWLFSKGLFHKSG